MNNVTIFIPVKNEAKRIVRCVDSVRGLGPVVLLDSQSEDDLEKIAEKLGVEVIQFHWNGRYPKKRNWALENIKIETEWVLFLDADEIVSPHFCEEVRRVLPETTHDGFWLNFENRFMGKTLRHGDRMRKLALFRVGKGHYERIEEDYWSHLDMEIHEHPLIEGSVGEICASILHEDDRGLSYWVKKHNEYSDWEVKRFLWLENNSKLDLNVRQQKKYGNLDKWWLAPGYGFYSFFVKLGFLDGRAGIIFTFLKIWYFWLIRQKLYESR